MQCGGNNAKNSGFGPDLDPIGKTVQKSNTTPEIRDRYISVSKGHYDHQKECTGGKLDKHFLGITLRVGWVRDKAKCAKLCKMCKIVQNVQCCKKCAKNSKICKIVQTGHSCAKLRKMCKICKIVQKVQYCAKCSMLCKMCKIKQNV